MVINLLRKIEQQQSLVKRKLVTQASGQLETNTILISKASVFLFDFGIFFIETEICSILDYYHMIDYSIVTTSCTNY